MDGGGQAGPAARDLQSGRELERRLAGAADQPQSLVLALEHRIVDPQHRDVGEASEGVSVASAGTRRLVEQLALDLVVVGLAGAAAGRVVGLDRLLRVARVRDLVVVQPVGVAGASAGHPHGEQADEDQQEDGAGDEGDGSGAVGHQPC
ncbi:hypothetical protein HMF7854_09915 [Sphingomonas ginkgonis]|uniref:Uncharacterized protein n=1 Tax=Sphingomonas ginkgonis TaxID=2315330 RepID=A0A429VBB3_9SPHN|nr:hypothetical protein HMF7854_09915 [Sphingomonas ginkgonis]